MLKRGVLVAPTATCFLSTAVRAADEDRFLTAFEACLKLPGVADA
jgi:glutamate-1-semialdehyde aminotransferase